MCVDVVRLGGRALESVQIFFLAEGEQFGFVNLVYTLTFNHSFIHVTQRFVVIQSFPTLEG